MGGKAALKDEIIASLPLKCDRYVEVFGGGATIMLAKPRDKFEIYNDFNSDLVNMFRCIKEMPLSFFKTAGYLPLNSRQEFADLQKFLQKQHFDSSYIKQETKVAKEILTEEEANQICTILQGRTELYDVERAVAFYKVIRYSYGSSGKSFGSQPVNLENALLGIYAVSDRLKNVVIENKDFEGLIKQYDRKNTAFYADPPYYMSESFYQVGFGLEDHLRLSECLHHIEGKFLLSYNDCDFIKDLYKDCCIVELSRPHSLAQRYSAGKVFKELLISNFDINERRKSEPTQLTLFGDEIYARNLLQEYRQKRTNNYTVMYENCLRDKR